MIISLRLIADAQFYRARELNLPVRVLDARTFILPSATRPALTDHHRVQFDDADSPRAFECSCEAALFAKPCWAAARALDVMMLLADHDITIERVREDADGAIEKAILFDEPLAGHFNVLRQPFVVDVEGDGDALLVAQKPRRAERVGGFSI